MECGDERGFACHAIEKTIWKADNGGCCAHYDCGLAGERSVAEQMTFEAIWERDGIIGEEENDFALCGGQQSVAPGSEGSRGRLDMAKQPGSRRFGVLAGAVEDLIAVGGQSLCCECVEAPG